MTRKEEIEKAANEFYKGDEVSTFVVAAQWADKTMIDKACEWLKNNWREYVYQDGDGIVHFGHWESDLRNAMEE